MLRVGHRVAMDSNELLQLAGRLSATWTAGDLDHTLSQITRAAVEVLPGVDYASITILHADQRLETIAPTDDLLWGVDAAQYELREGPCYEAAADAVQVVSPDLASDARFPRYAAAATAAGIYAQAGLRLFDAPKSRGALNLYSRETGALKDLSELTDLFTHHSAIAIDYAQQISNLQDAMHTRGLVGQAVGLVMERYGLSDERAFAFLTRLSQHGNVKLRTLAEQLVAAEPRQH
jgi:hypothetical protein